MQATSLQSFKLTTFSPLGLVNYTKSTSMKYKSIQEIRSRREVSDSLSLCPLLVQQGSPQDHTLANSIHRRYYIFTGFIQENTAEIILHKSGTKLAVRNG